MIGIETLKKRIEPEKYWARKSKYQEPLANFVQSDDMTLIFKCSNVSETQSCRAAVRKQINDRNLNLVVWSKNCTVYVIKG